MKNKIKELASNFFEEIVQIRRHLHKYPELSFKENETSKYIKNILNKWKIPYIDNIANNGIVVVLKGLDPQFKTIALRADIDALPIIEETNCSYSSENYGVMHACGHDAHTASLLGVLRILHKLSNLWHGTIKFIFQPAEEMLPGGAQQMISEGVLKNPEVDMIFAQHVFPDLEYGKVGFKSGKYMASTDELYIKIQGIGGHAAIPEKYNNPILAASDLILELNRYFIKKIDNRNVFAIGYINANGSTNVIPEFVNLKGTFRALNEKFRYASHKYMKEISNIMSKKHNVTIDFNIKVGYPCLVNDKNLTNSAVKLAQEFIGKHNVVELPLRMTAEDFSYYSEKIPSCFYRLGTGNKQKDIKHGLHTSRFNIDERSLEIGMGLMAYLAIKS